MKISTKIAFNILLFISFSLGMLAAHLVMTHKVDQALRNDILVNRILSGVNDLNSATYDFVLHFEERPRMQWELKHASLEKLIRTIETDEKDLLEQIARNHGIAKTLFEMLADKSAAWSDLGQTPNIYDEDTQRVVAQLIARTRMISADAALLTQATTASILSLNQNSFHIVLGLILLMTGTVTASSFLLKRKVVGGLRKLQEGMQIVAAGDLAHRVNMTANDEIGELSRAFDVMTEKLESTTVSRDALSREIEERKRAEEELSRNREWFRVTLNSIGDAVIATDASGLVIFSNPVAEALTGRQAQDAVGKVIGDVFCVVNEDTQLPIESIVDRVLHEGSIVRLANHTALITPDGRSIPIEDSAAPIRDSAGNIMGVVLVFHDVTEKRRAQEALREAQSRLTVILNSIVDGFFALDSEWRFTHINDAALAYFGKKRGDVIGSPIAEVFQAFVGSVFESGYRHAMDTGKPVSLEATSLIRDRIIEVHAYPGPGNLTVLFRDINERKMMEAELRKSRDELEQRVQERTSELRMTIKRLELINAELQEFAHVASHDLQEPLRKIQTFSDMAMKRCGPALDAAGRDHLGRILSSAGRMRQLLHDLLLYSRVANRLEPVKKIDLAGIVHEAADIFETSVAETGCVIEIEEMPAVEADESQMLQLFQNLIGNAIKYRGGETPRVRIHGRSKGPEMCEIIVEDNGIGFESRFAELIFKPFQRLHGRRSEYDGTGIGLAICRKIVERHGGAIWAESEPGKGSKFIVRLPLAQIDLENQIGRSGAGRRHSGAASPR